MSTVPAADGTIAALRPDSHGWFHPADEAGVCQMIVEARRQGRRLRVRGAHHSVPAAVAGSDDLIVVLDRLRDIRYDPASAEIVAGGGARIGQDPLNPRGGHSPVLLDCLRQHGRALPNIGGVTHQTVAGFLATGSAGGSARHDAASAVAALRLVDGTGQVHALRRGVDDARLDAVLVSAGMFGIVTEVTFTTVPAYDVAGTETVVPDRGGVLDLFADGANGLQAFLERAEYARVLWWPQRHVRRLNVWSARRVDAADPEPAKPYDPMPRVFGSLQPAQWAAGLLLWMLVHWRRIRHLLGAGLMRRAERMASPLEGVVYRAFVDGDPGQPQRFRGSWSDILPQDQQMDERWMPTTFTEIFVPLTAAAEALRRLDLLFDAEPGAAGQFAIELYASPASTAWLHPSYGRASLRINVFWLMHSTEDPRDRFLPRIWEALEVFAPRLHWGKLFPHQPASMVDGRFPRLDDVRALRAQFDPDRVFLSRWLGAALSVPGCDLHPSAPLPRTRMPAAGLRWPLLFRLDPSDRALLGRADYVYEFERVVKAQAGTVLSAMFDGRPESAAPGFVRFHWHTPIGEFRDAIMDETFVFMNIRMRTVQYEPGRGLSISVDRCSMPLASQMLQDMELTPVDGGTLFRWRIAVRYRRDTAFMAPLVTPMFRWLFATTLARLERRFAAGAA